MPNRKPTSKRPFTTDYGATKGHCATREGALCSAFVHLVKKGGPWPGICAGPPSRHPPQVAGTGAREDVRLAIALCPRHHAEANEKPRARLLRVTAERDGLLFALRDAEAHAERLKAESDDLRVLVLEAQQQVLIERSIPDARIAALEKALIGYMQAETRPAAAYRQACRALS